MTGIPVTPNFADGPLAGSTLAAEALAWCDRLWDEERGLPWAPAGHESFTGKGALHLIPQAGWYAVGLLVRGADGDHDRAMRIVDNICDLQYNEPGTDWHGTYPIMAETPHPPADASMWAHYDPNWRQFLGLSWVLMLARFANVLPSATADRLVQAVRLGVEGEPPSRCPATYTNIALKRAAFESIAGGLLDEPTWVLRAEALTEEVVALHDLHGAFEEFNSPTYAGVDFFALSIARQLSPSAAIRGAAEHLEASLWRTIADLYHPTLRNLAAPWTRTYGMDMNSYVAKAMFALQLIAEDVAPSPGFADDVAHGHDWFAAPICSLVGTMAPDDAVVALRTIGGLVDQRISDRRSATAWLGERVMMGAETCRADLSWWDQYIAAAMHWETSSRGIGWLSVRMPGRSAATAGEGYLDVPAGGATKGAVVVVGGCGEVTAPTGRNWSLPGLDVVVSTTLEQAGPGPFGGTCFVAPAGADVRFELA